MADKAFLVDTTKCIGCRACQVACKQWNNLPAEKTQFFSGTEYTNPKELSEITYNHVVFFDVDRTNQERPVWQIMHKKCYHCQIANCMNVCPQKAISKVEGWTIIDQDKCIGCGACEDECIYKVPHISNKDYREYATNRLIRKNKSYKCHACTINPRDIPACVSTCPTGALSWGNRVKILEIANIRLSDIKKDYPNASIYGKNQFGGLHVITILKDRPDKYMLEMNPKPVDANRITTTNELYSLLSIFTLGLPFLKRSAYKISKALTSRGNLKSS